MGSEVPGGSLVAPVRRPTVAGAVNATVTNLTSVKQPRRDPEFRRFQAHFRLIPPCKRILTVRLKYCDGNSSLHWTQLGVAKIFSETELAVQHSTASLHPGKPDHPECQGEAPAELERPQ